MSPQHPPMSPVNLQVPATQAAIPYVQHAVRWFVEQAAMEERKRYAIDLAIEELILTLLRYSFDEGREQGKLEFTIEMRPTILKLEVTCRGLPFDLSMVPDYDPDTDADDAALSVLLLKHMVDRYRLYNEGKQGYRIELEWLRPVAHVKQLDESTGGQTVSAGINDAPVPISTIRPLHEDEALALARLVYRSYGYSYVSEFLYYPERIVARIRDGMLHSWVAVSEAGDLAGHAALTMSHRDADAAEWGIGVVDPRWRGMGLLKSISQEVIRHASTTPASVLFVHSVTNHPHTQKSGIGLGFESTALLLGFAPASLQFRHIHDTLSQRESVFIGTQILKPLPDQPLHLPPRHADALHRLARGVGLRLTEAPALAHRMQATTTFDSMIEPAVNVAVVNLTCGGSDLPQALARERRRLCREKVDIVYLNIDLADPCAPQATDIAEVEGFFLAGMCPMQPWPYTLTLQYLNNLEFDYNLIHAVGEQAQWLKAYVEQEQQRVLA